MSKTEILKALDQMEQARHKATMQEGANLKRYPNGKTAIPAHRPKMWQGWQDAAFCAFLNHRKAWFSMWH